MRKAIYALIISSLIILPFANVLAYGTDYRYTGKPFDPNTNLYYYGQRYYDPNVGRFTQPDPLQNYLTDPQKLKQTTGQDLQKFLENPQALNEYSYTQNNPVKYVDPTGEYIAPYDYTTDVLFFSQSFSDYRENKNWINATSLALDTIGLLPVIPAGTGSLFKGLVKGVNYLSDLYKTSRTLKVFEKAIKNGKYVIDRVKFSDYILNMEHAIGKHKAIQFEKILGYNQGNTDLLIKEIQSNLDKGKFILKEITEYGTTFSIDMAIKGVNGNITNVRTGWILDKGSETPRLVTSFINN